MRWDEARGELYVHDVPEFTPVDEFAREYGDQLILSASTEYVDIPSDLVVTLHGVSSTLG